MTLSEVSALALAYLDQPGNSVGGNLHIVLDDGNVDDYSVGYCHGFAEAKGDDDGARLASALACLSEAQREALYQNGWALAMCEEQPNLPETGPECKP